MTTTTFPQFERGRANAKPSDSVRNVDPLNLIDVNNGNRDNIINGHSLSTTHHPFHWRLDLQNRIIAAVLEEASIETLIDVALSTLFHHFPEERVVYGTIDRDGILVLRRCWQPSTMRDLTGLTADLKKVIPSVLETLQQNKPFLSADVEHDQRLKLIKDELLVSGAQAILNVPLRHPHQLVGLICFDSAFKRVWQAEEIATFVEIAQLLSVVLHKADERETKFQLEAATRFQQSLLDSLQQVSLDGYVVLSAQHEITAWNQRLLEIWNFTEAELCTYSFAQFVLRLSELSGQAPSFWEQLSAPTTAQVPTEITLPDERIISFHKSILVADASPMLGEVWFFRDITQQYLHAIQVRQQLIRRRLIEAIWKTREEEQRRIARDLHDSVGQSLTGLILGLQAAQKQLQLKAKDAILNELQSMLQSAMVDVGRMVQNLRPALLDDLGLEAAVRRLIRDLVDKHPLQFQVNIELPPGLRLGEDLETTLYRIIQESLNNILKHAAATEVTLRLYQQPQAIALIIQDNGRGFVTASTDRDLDYSGMGLTGMQERVELLSGTFEIQSRIGTGTRIKVCLPFFHTHE
jgi:signal transduction histidine kinase